MRANKGKRRAERADRRREWVPDESRDFISGVRAGITTWETGASDLGTRWCRRASDGEADGPRGLVSFIFT